MRAKNEKTPRRNENILFKRAAPSTDRPPAVQLHALTSTLGRLTFSRGDINRPHVLGHTHFHTSASATHFSVSCRSLPELFCHSMFCYSFYMSNYHLILLSHILHRTVPLIRLFVSHSSGSVFAQISTPGFPPPVALPQSSGSICHLSVSVRTTCMLPCAIDPRSRFVIET